MSQKKRKRERERIPALSGSIETPPTMSFQLELKLQHYIIPKTSLWLIIPWEPGTDAARRVTDAAAGANSPFWVHGLRDRPRAALGQPPKPLPSPEIGDHWGHQFLVRHPHHPVLAPHGVTALPPRPQLFLTAGGAGTHWSWWGRGGGEDVIYVSEQIRVLDKP